MPPSRGSRWTPATTIRCASGPTSRPRSIASVRASGAWRSRGCARRACPRSVAVDELVNGLAAYGEPARDRARRPAPRGQRRVPGLVGTRWSACRRTRGSWRRRARSRPSARPRCVPAARSASIARPTSRSRVDEARTLLVDTRGRCARRRRTSERSSRAPRAGRPALYLAALWLARVDDLGRAIARVPGERPPRRRLPTREVLDSLDRRSREFLLRAAVLGRFSGGLCDAVLGSAATRPGGCAASSARTCS